MAVFRVEKNGNYTVMSNEKNVIVGLDIGNFDVKTQFTCLPSGFTESETAPFGIENVLEWNGKFYCSSPTRFPYSADKTTDERCFVLSLMGIGNQLIDFAEKQVGGTKSREELAAVISSIRNVNLAVGLPITHFSSGKEKTLEYYRRNLEKPVEYEWRGFLFSFTVQRVECFPQGLSALIVHPTAQDSVNSFPTYALIDIGGWTVDIVTIRGRQLDLTGCDSKPLGTLALVDKIISQVEKETGLRLNPVDVFSLLRGEKTLISNEIREKIQGIVEEWFSSIMQHTAQFGIDPKVTPIIFMGGGALLFQNQIKNDKKLVKYELLIDPHVNAKAYAILLSKMMADETQK